MSHAQTDVYTSIQRKLFVVAPLAWMTFAAALVASGTLARASPYTFPVMIVGLTAATLGVLWQTSVGRAFSTSLSLAQLAGFHAWRIVPGAAFLILYRLGELPWSFAVPAGVGDVAVGVLAPLVAWSATRRGGRAALLAFTLLGAVDLLIVVRAAFVLLFTDPESLHLLRELPLGLLPTFAVPLTFAAHGLALRRVLGPRRL
jgi:hypothetical protein